MHPPPKNQSAEVNHLERLRPGDILGSYQLLTPIARGGMGMVWAARRTGRLGLPQLVAVKTALSLANEQTEQLFFDEARVAASIDHPNVCRVHDLGEEDGVLYLAMDWIDGASLAKLVNAVPGRRLDVHLAAYIVAEACAGLHAAHQLKDEDGELLGVVHRDATPQNILVSTKGAVKVIDFGIVKARDQVHEETKMGEVKGKLSYLAPEQLLGKSCDLRVDVFALGAVLHLVSTGEDAFRGNTAGETVLQVLNGRFTLPSSVVAGYPRELEAAVLRALAPKPEDRFSSAEELELALRKFLKNSGAVVGPEDVSRLLSLHLGQTLQQQHAKIRAAQEHYDSQPSRRIVLPSQPDETARVSNGLSLSSANIDRSMSGTRTPDAVALDLPQPATGRSYRSALWAGGATLVAGTAMALAFWSSPPTPGVEARSGATRALVEQAVVHPASPDSVAGLATVLLRVFPPDAALSVDDGPPESGPLELRAPVGSSPRTVRVSAAGHATKRIQVAFGHSRVEVIELERATGRRPGPLRGRGPLPAATSNGTAQQTAELPFSAPLAPRSAPRSIDVSDPFKE